MADNFVQIGTAALRTPSGECLPAIPLYIKVDESAVDAETGVAACETELYKDIGAVLLPHFKQYVEGVKASKIEKR